MSSHFIVAPWMFGEGPPDDPYPCQDGDECTVHNTAIQDWFQRMEARYQGQLVPNAWDPRRAA